MGDPNGIVFYQDRYHVFYQHNPDGFDFGNPNWAKVDKVPWGPAANPDIPKGIWGRYWGNQHWGHAVSDDLVHWEHWPTALSPTPGGYDDGGCFSGCTVINNGVPTIVYTSTTRIPAAGIRTRRAQSIATSNDGMRTWDKHPANPVLADVPDHSGLMTAWHDPHVWQEGDTWYMALGCGFQNIAGAVLLYQSPDLLHWEYMSPLLVSTDIANRGDRWLVPDFFPIDDKYVLLLCVSTPAGECFTTYAVGDYVDHCFVPEVEGVLGPRPAPSAMATRSLLDDRGRRIVRSQLGEDRWREAARTLGYTGILSLPWQLNLSADLTLEVEAVEEVCSTGKPHWHLADVPLAAHEPLHPEGLAGDCLEIVADIDVGHAEQVAVKLRCSPDGEEQTAIVFDAKQRRICLDSSQSSTNPNYCGVSRGAPLKLARDEPLHLHLFLDRSVVEAFANRRACVFDRIAPVREDSLNVTVVAKGGEAELLSLDAWRKAPVPITG